jgi:hypothetical protein
MEEHRLTMADNRELGGIFGPNGEEVAEGSRNCMIKSFLKKIKLSL